MMPMKDSLASGCLATALTDARVFAQGNSQPANSLLVASTGFGVVVLLTLGHTLKVYRLEQRTGSGGFPLFARELVVGTLYAPCRLDSSHLLVQA